MNDSRNGEVNIAEQNAAVVSLLQNVGYELRQLAGQPRYVVAVEGKSKGILTLDGLERFFEPFRGHDYFEVHSALQFISNSVRVETTGSGSGGLDSAMEDENVAYEIFFRREHFNQPLQ